MAVDYTACMFEVYSCFLKLSYTLLCLLLYLPCPLLYIQPTALPSSIPPPAAYFVVVTLICCRCSRLVHAPSSELHPLPHRALHLRLAPNEGDGVLEGLDLLGLGGLE
eukprot:768719-Hanusia_phi.AAC.1